MYLLYDLIFEEEEKTNPLLPKSKDIFNFMIGPEIMAFVKLGVANWWIQTSDGVSLGRVCYQLVQGQGVNRH